MVGQNWTQISDFIDKLLQGGETTIKSMRAANAEKQEQQEQEEKTKTFESEKKVANKAPVESVTVANISKALKL